MPCSKCRHFGALITPKYAGGAARHFCDYPRRLLPLCMQADHLMRQRMVVASDAEGCPTYDPVKVEKTQTLITKEPR